MAYSSWYKRHSFDLNQEYAENTLKQFNINKYHFIRDGYGSLALLIDFGIDIYRIEINENEKKMYIKKKILRRKGQKHSKEYWIIIGTTNRDCIFNSLKIILKERNT